MLNIAAMTIGTSAGPRGVPDRASHLFGAAAAVHQFRVRGRLADGCRSGVIEDSTGTACRRWAHWLRDPIRLFRNTGTGTFEERTSASGLDGITGGLNLVHTDFDNDGRPDILVLRGGWMGAAGQFPLSLLHNLGGWRFADVTKAAGLGDVEGPTQTRLVDYYGAAGSISLSARCPLSGYRRFASGFSEQSRGTFTDVTKAVGMTLASSKRGRGRYDNAAADLYLSRRGPEPPSAHDGPRRGRCASSDTTAKAAWSAANTASRMWFAYDNDGGSTATSGLSGQSRTSPRFPRPRPQADRSRL